ncbi:unnamed protein product [Prorocentrum cordatum]|uniref:RRM domain-containing protein n=1 Tax=Prorocentrum cordatum TaxID=2364126 RepID=A0ABN9WEE0_9DINO|nr:unnamed protein product [Polarella glacialis]
MFIAGQAPGANLCRLGQEAPDLFQHHGFINFKTPEAARAFAAAWHRSRRLGMEDETGQVVPLNVSNASLQGLEANLRKWTGARVTRIKNPEFLPFVLRDAEPQPRACVLETPGSAAIDAARPR